MYAVCASRTMANAKPKIRESDVAVRDIVQIREAKRREREEAPREAKRREEEDRKAKEAVAAVIAKYRVIEWTGRRTAKMIIAEVAARHRVSVESILSPRRSKYIVKIRDEAIRAVADERHDMSLPAIGRVFRRDHTTIYHSLQKTRPEGAPR